MKLFLPAVICFGISLSGYASEAQVLTPLTEQSAGQQVGEISPLVDDQPRDVAIIPGGANAEPIALIRASVIPQTDWEKGIVQLEIQLADGCHLYSLTQEDARQTKLELAESPLFQIAGAARSSVAPEWEEGVEDPAQYHKGKFSFIIPIALLCETGSDPQVLIRLNGMICSDAGICVPIRNRILMARTASAVAKLSLDNPGNQQTGEGSAGFLPPGQQGSLPVKIR